MITLGTTAPSGAAASGTGTGRMYATAYALSGAPAGSVFQTIRLRVRNDNASAKTVRGVVYNNSNVIVDWAAYTLAGSAPDQIISIPLTGAVVVTDATYKIGIQVEMADLIIWLKTSGASTTTNYWTGSASWAGSPPSPWSPDGSIAWQVAAEADVGTTSSTYNGSATVSLTATVTAVGRKLIHGSSTTSAVAVVAVGGTRTAPTSLVLVARTPSSHTLIPATAGSLVLVPVTTLLPALTLTPR